MQSNKQMYQDVKLYSFRDERVEKALVKQYNQDLVALKSNVAVQSFEQKEIIRIKSIRQQNFINFQVVTKEYENSTFLFNNMQQRKRIRIPIVFLFGDRLPQLANDDQIRDFYHYFISEMSDIYHQFPFLSYPIQIFRYIIIYFSQQGDQLLGLLKEFYKKLPQKYNNNLSQIFLIGSSWMNRMQIHLSKKWSTSIYQKIVNLTEQEFIILLMFVSLTAIFRIDQLKAFYQEILNEIPLQYKKGFIQQLAQRDLDATIQPQQQKIFGRELHEYKQDLRQGIPEFVSILIQHFFVDPKTMEAVGIFRKNADAYALRKIDKCVPQHNYQYLFNLENSITIAGAIKKFFRDLKHPLFPQKASIVMLYLQLLNLIELRTYQEKFFLCQSILGQLPELNYRLFHFMVELFLEVDNYQLKVKPTERMNLHNICVCFAPNFLRLTKEQNQQQQKQHLALSNPQQQMQYLLQIEQQQLREYKDKAVTVAEVLKFIILNKDKLFFEGKDVIEHVIEKEIQIENQGNLMEEIDNIISISKHSSPKQEHEKMRLKTSYQDYQTPLIQNLYQSQHQEQAKQARHLTAKQQEEIIIRSIEQPLMTGSPHKRLTDYQKYSPNKFKSPVKYQTQHVDVKIPKLDYQIPNLRNIYKNYGQYCIEQHEMINLKHTPKHTPTKDSPYKGNLLESLDSISITNYQQHEEYKPFEENNDDEYLNELTKKVAIQKQLKDLEEQIAKERTNKTVRVRSNDISLDNPLYSSLINKSQGSHKKTSPLSDKMNQFHPKIQQQHQKQLISPNLDFLDSLQKSRHGSTPKKSKHGSTPKKKTCGHTQLKKPNWQEFDSKYINCSHCKSESLIILAFQCEDCQNFLCGTCSKDFTKA